MTPIRRLALKISNAVVRYASPGCKEWAEGLAREVAFVEGDWAALGWALGSVRVLFDHREVPIASLADLATEAEKFAQLANDNHTWLYSATSFGWGLLYVCQSFRATNGPLERIGCSLAALGFTAMGVVILIEWHRRRNVPPSSDVNAVIQFYKARLERVRDIYRSPKGWMMTSASAVMSVGMVLAQRGGARPVYAEILGLVWVFLVLFVLQMRRINRRRLERLKALLAETPMNGL